MPVDDGPPVESVEQDFAAFDAALRAASGALFVAGGPPVFAARAPGRLDVLGGIAEYAGSLVAELPIRQAAVVAAQRDDASGGAVIVGTSGAAGEGLADRVELPAALFINPVSLLRWMREAPPAERWAGYVAGAFSILRAEGLPPRGVGARLFVHSDVPVGAGVASSAAVGVAAMRALCAAFGIPMEDGLALARLSQRIENEVVDIPCSVADQATAALGEADRLLLVLCQPFQLQGTIGLPDGWSLIGVGSGVDHDPDGVRHRRVRAAAFMGYKMLADRAGNGFGGYLCNVTPDAYRALLPERLPEAMTGAAFLGQHGGIFDTVATVAPGETYPVRAATEQAIEEMARVTRFVECLRAGDDGAMLEAGMQLLASHDAYSRCGLGSMETDLLVADASRFDAVAGARVTGAGSGGAVCVLCRTEAAARIAQSMADEYQIRTGRRPHLLRGSSPGAMASVVRSVVLP